MGAFQITRRKLLCRFAIVATGLVQVLRGRVNASGTKLSITPQRATAPGDPAEIRAPDARRADRIRSRRPVAHTQDSPAGQVVAIGRGDALVGPVL